jgi:hypothetical protein
MLKSECYESEGELSDISLRQLMTSFIKLKEMNKLYYGRRTDICTNQSVPDDLQTLNIDMEAFCILMDYLNKTTNENDANFLDRERYTNMTITAFNTYIDTYYDFYFTRRFSPERLNKIRHILFNLTTNLLKNNVLLPRRLTTGYINKDDAIAQNDTDKILDLQTYDYILAYTKLEEQETIENFKSRFTLPPNMFQDIKDSITCTNQYYAEVKHLLDIVKFENYTISLEEQREEDNKNKLKYEFKKGRMLYSTKDPELS